MKFAVKGAWCFRCVGNDDSSTFADIRPLLQENCFNGTAWERRRRKDYRIHCLGHRMSSPDFLPRVAIAYTTTSRAGGLSGADLRFDYAEASSIRSDYYQSAQWRSVGTTFTQKNLALPKPPLLRQMVQRDPVPQFLA